jgi:hypothetical protein
MEWTDDLWPTPPYHYGWPEPLKPTQGKVGGR